MVICMLDMPMSGAKTLEIARYDKIQDALHNTGITPSDKGTLLFRDRVVNRY